MKRQFTVDGYFVQTMYSCIYLQYTSTGEGCRLLSEYKSAVNGSYLYTALKARKIHQTNSGEPYIILRGRRLHLRDFIRVGGPWSSLPKNYTVEY